MDEAVITGVPELLAILGPEWVHRYQAIPLKKSGSILYLGLIDPTNQNSINAIMFQTGLRIYPQLIAEQEWHTFIETHCPLTATPPILPDVSHEEITLGREETHNDPIVKFVDQLLRDAIQKMASDIHIEPFAAYCQIRFRQDGILYKITELNHTLALRFITRLKVMTKLDISERRLPQDGRLHWLLDQHKIDMRISTCPTVHGEKVVLRILDARNTALSIDSLGLLAEQKNIFLKHISAPQGLVLVAGPTGSGKTVTLYSALQFLNTIGKNISTVEDPVEIQLPGINQVNIHPKIGLTFATMLRTLLRQDPDILMVGEIRDAETAEIAIQAAHTGHLVLSTIHTNNTRDTLARLQAMGIQPYHLAQSLSLIVAQRLVRKLCSSCKQPDLLTGNFQSIGCPHCLQGYKGRTAIYELLPMTDVFAQGIATYAHTPDFISLLDAGQRRVAEGITSLSEIHRVLRT